MSQPNSNEKILKDVREKVRAKVEGVLGTNMHVSWKEIESIVLEALVQKDAEVAEAVSSERQRIWGEIVKLADDFNGDLDTNLDNVWTIMQIPPALTPKE